MCLCVCACARAQVDAGGRQRQRPALKGVKKPGARLRRWRSPRSRRPCAGPRVRRERPGLFWPPWRPRALPRGQSPRWASGRGRRGDARRGRSCAAGASLSALSSPSLPRVSCAKTAVAASPFSARSRRPCHGGLQQVLDGAKLLASGGRAPAALPAP